MAGFTPAPAQCRLNLLAMIQEDYGAYVSSIDRRELLFSNFGQAQRASIRFSHEAVNHIV